MKADGSIRGMSLVEVTIVIVVLGVIMAGVFMMFISGTEHFEFARRQNELDLNARMILDRVTNEIIWAGYMPVGGWENDEWHPITKASPDSMSFFADLDESASLEPTDYRHITRINDQVRITDEGSRLQNVGDDVTSLQFTYLDEGGSQLPFPIDSTSRDLIRHVRITLILTSIYGDNVLQTVMHTSVSPRNLGVNHNIDPMFWPPEPMRGLIVLNVAGDSLNPAPTVDEDEFSTRLQYWGYTVRELTDDQLIGYDYTEVDALILRHIPGGSHYDGAYPTFFADLAVPTITLSAQDAVELYAMGTSYGEIQEDRMTVLKFGPPAHFTGTFNVYEELTNGYQSVLTGMSPATGDTLYIVPGTFMDSSGVYATNLELVPDSLRRVHFSAWQSRSYTERGWEVFFNIVKWLAVDEEGYLGTPITTLEDFEGPQATAQDVIIWSDDIVPAAGTDTSQIFIDQFTGGYASNWTMAPLGGGRISIYNNSLRMDRSAAGAVTRNLASLGVDLSAFDENVDDLRLTYRSYSGEGAADSADGVFFNDFTATQLASVDFESGALPYPNVTFSGTGGRYTRRNTAGWGGNGYFVTLDALTDYTYGSSRMRVSVPTAGVSAGDAIAISYRFHDHSDENHTGGASNWYADFLAWNSTGAFTPGTLLYYLNPASYDNNTWFTRTAAFTVPAVVPNPLYVVFGQYGNRQATAINATDGISLDDITVTAYGDSTYSSIGTCAGAASWASTAVDLDQAARSAAYPFAADYRIVLSQSGSGTMPGSGGRLWDDVEITAQRPGTVVDGWRHGRMAMNRVDDWNYKTVIPAFADSWVSQTSSGSNYSNNSYCFLQSPAISVPDWIDAPVFEFSHRMSGESGNGDDGGYVQISVDGGVWTNLTASSGLLYNFTSTANFPGGAGIAIFGGQTISSPRIERISLAAYKGHTVRFRFVFGSDGSTTSTGWLLDNFLVHGQAVGYQIGSIQFQAQTVPAAWNYLCDVYMSSGTDSSFASAGEWDKAAMVQVGSAVPFTVGTGGWNTLALENPFVLSPGENLYLKIEQLDAGWTASEIEWLCSTGGEIRCRHAESDLVDPVLLLLYNSRPNVRLVTTDGELVVEGGTNPDASVPLNNGSSFNDCEMIFTTAEMGTEGGAGAWTHGGVLDDWEIGAPVVLSVDPPLTSENGASIAGTDLTDDGYYSPYEWAWFLSPPYPMPDEATYDSVAVQVFKCLQNAPNDDAFIQVAFSDTEVPPDSASSDWINVRSYFGVGEEIWDYEAIDLTAQFETAWTLGRAYFFIRFLESSGPFGELGGWNLDNIQFFAR